MANAVSRKIKGWITRFGVHIPIYEKYDTEQTEKPVKKASYTNVIGMAQMLAEEEFDRQAEEHDVYYRGGKTDNPQDLLPDSSYRANRHSRGNGLYMTSSKETANEHARGKSTISGFMTKDSKVITEREGHDLYYKETKKKPKKATQVTGYLSKKGYDAMKVEGARFGKEDYLVVFNRNKPRYKKGAN